MLDAATMLIDVAEWRVDILEEHLEELESLWNRRLRAPRSAELEAVGLGRLDSRIEAHTDALVLAEDHAWPLVEAALASDQPAAAAAAAMVIASAGGHEYERRLVAALAAAAPPIRDGIRAALELRASAGLRKALGAAVGVGAAPAVAAATAVVFAAHGGEVALDSRRAWLGDPDAEVRRMVWRMEAHLASGAGGPGRHATGAGRGHAAPHQGPQRADYLRAFGDADREVRRVALEVAARTRQPWLLEQLRATAAAPSARAVDQHLMLAILSAGEPADLALLSALGRSPELGWYRYALLALWARAPAVEELLRTMREAAPVDAALAAAAFHRVTGIDVRRAERIPLVPAGAPADELCDEIKACDTQAAERAWEAARARIGAARWIRGADAESLNVATLPATLDLETRHAWQLRSQFHDPQAQVPFDAERFPFAAG
jgi:hypothetical protein